jgi:integrase
MATINFLYRSARENATLTLRLLYRINEVDFVFGGNTKFEVSKVYWSKQHKKRSKDIGIANEQTRLNNALNALENHVLNAFNLVNPNLITKAWLQANIDGYYSPPKQDKPLPTELVKYIAFYIDYRKNEIKETSKKKFNVIKHKLERFEKFRKKTILIKDVNDSFKKELVDYYKIEKYSQNTMQRELVFIKTFCKHARFLGAETHPQLDSLRLDRAKVEKVYLTFEELEKIEKIDKDKLTETFKITRDWLIISCYTGQRISDFMRFTKGMIRYEKNKDGVLKPFVEFTQVKTDKIMTVAVHPKVIEILEKRNGNFPKAISDPKYNLYLKQVCRIAKISEKVKGSKLIDLNKDEDQKNNEKEAVKQYRKESGMFPKWELITSHIGRRSFATNYYGTIPTTYLMNVTGHSTEAMFLRYIGKSNKDLAMEITNYF